MLNRKIQIMADLLLFLHGLNQFIINLPDNQYKYGSMDSFNLAKLFQKAHGGISFHEISCRKE